jgi:glutamine amidotransferase
MGWNNLEIKQQNNLLEGVDDGSWVYFVHSYMIKAKETELIVANTDYGIKVPAIIQQKNYIGTQFHPEKSGEVGSLMLSNFLSECKK